ncbi:hypothetical protein [Priestia megaterium]|uniref:Uncharacterized protein n=1 Tax=Priestia megaterium TaxID=1404 RepID=A0A6M6E4B2_PRIMG|nr:hypothetical protein [Priestia megaterium]QJX80009.1 hypothetical protein FDZ14_28305 [Priestia megaterium]
MTKNNNSRKKGDDSLLATRKLSNEAFVVPKGKSKEFLERFNAKKTSRSTASFWDECRTVSGKNKK